MHRVLLLAALALVALTPAPASGHAAANCFPDDIFPSLAAWNMPPGRTLSYWVPPEYFVAIASAFPLAVSMYGHAECELDASCHEHAANGLVTCATARKAIVEIHNPNAQLVPVAYAIGQCKLVDLC